MKIILMFTIILCYQRPLDSYRILGVFQHPGSSHFAVYRPLLRKLAEIGHEVTVISHFPLENPPKNYRDISMYGTLPIWKTSYDINNFVFPVFTGRIIKHILTGRRVTTVGVKSCEIMLQNPEVQALKSGDFDVIIVESFSSDCSMGIVYKMNVPHIVICSHVLLSWMMDNHGLITNPSYVASHFLEHGYKPGVLGTLEGLLVDEFLKWYFYFYSQIPEQKIVEKYIGHEIPALEQLARNASLVMVNTHSSLNGAYPVPPNLVEIGGIHLEKRQQLPEDIKKFLDDTPQGVILFSMGSLLKAISWPSEKLKAFRKVFAELRQKVIWKWENDTMEDMPNNIKIVKWIPQYDILCHKNVKVFITHGGISGVTEAVNCGVPALVLPFFGDQFCNGAALQEKGCGISLQYSNISEDSIRWALKTLLHPKSKQNAERLSSIWKDRPISAMNSAIFWIEYVVRNGGSHLQPTSKDLPHYRYLLLDVIALFVIIMLIIIYVIYKFVNIALKLIKYSLIFKIKHD